MGREILTIQLGHKANYLATHFWNAQVCRPLLRKEGNRQEAGFDYEDTNARPVIENDVHFRAGEGDGGVETYTPRTLIYDLKGIFFPFLVILRQKRVADDEGGFGSLRKVNELYAAAMPPQHEQEKGVSNWYILMATETVC